MANEIFSEIKNLRPKLKFCHLTHNGESFNFRHLLKCIVQHIFTTSLRPERYADCIQIRNIRGDDYFYLLDRSSSKHRCVTHSSSGAEVIATAKGNDRTFHFKEELQALDSVWEMEGRLIVESKSLNDTITTLHENREFRLRQTVQRLRDSFESGQLNRIRWVHTFANLADSPTKRNHCMHRLLDRVCQNGLLLFPSNESVEADFKNWQ